MAELTARLRLIADIRNFSQNLQKGAQQARTALGGLDRQVGQVGTGLNSANKASKSFFQTLRANVATQIKAGIMFATLYQALITFRQTIGAAIAEMFNLDEALRKVQSISKDADETIEGLKNSLIRAAREGKLFGQTAAEVAVGMFEIVQAGFNTAEAFEIATVAAQAATAGFTDAATAGKVITGTLLAFEMGADSARYVANVLFQTVDTGVVTFEQLAQGLGVAMAPAAQMNVTLEELGAAVALMTRKGIPANRAMTSLTRILFQFLDPSEQAFKAAEKMGFALDSQTVKTNGLLGAMRLLNDATGGDEELLADVFDRQRALIGAFSLLADGGEDWAEILVDVNGAQADAGALTLAWDERSKALTVRLEVLRAQVLALVVQGLQPLMAGLGVVVDWLSRMIADEMGVFKWLKNTATGVTGLSEAWNDFTRALKNMFAEGQGDRLSLMFRGMFVILREGIPNLFVLLAILLRVGAWAMQNKPALIAIALAFGAMFISAHPLLAVFQALFILVGYMEKNWDKWWVKILGTTAAVLLAVSAFMQLRDAFMLSRAAMFLFQGVASGIGGNKGVGFVEAAVINLRRAVMETVGRVVHFFDSMANAAQKAADQANRVVQSLTNILEKPVNIARTVTVNTIQAGQKAEGAAAKAATGVGAAARGGIQGVGIALGAGFGNLIKNPVLRAGLARFSTALAGVFSATMSTAMALATNPIFLIVTAALITAFLIYKYRKEIWGALQTLGPVIRDFFLKELPSLMNQYFLQPLQAFFTETLPAWAKAQFTAENMGRWFGRILMVAVLLALWPAVLVYKFRDKLLYFVGFVAGFLAKLPGRLAEKIGDAADVIIGKLIDVVQWVAAFRVKMIEFEISIRSFVIELPGKIGSFLADAADVIIGKLIDVVQWVAAFRVKMIKFEISIRSFVIELPGKIGSFLADSADVIIGALIDPSKWWDAFKTLLDEFVTIVSEKIGPILNAIGIFFSESITQGIRSAFSGLVDAIKAAVRGALNTIPGPVKAFLGGILPGAQDILDWAGSGGGEGKPSEPWWAPTRRGYQAGATGIRNFMGGLALVGERGAELVRLPRGADVIRNADMGQAVRGAGGGVSVSAEVNITTSMMREYEDLKRRVIQEVEEKLDDAAATAGLAKPRLGTLGAGIPRT